MEGILVGFKVLDATYSVSQNSISDLFECIAESPDKLAMLVFVRRGFLQEACFLQMLFSSVQNNSDPLADFAREMCVLRLHDAWSRFNRRLVVEIAAGNAMTLGGIALRPAFGIKRRSDVIPALLATYKNRKNEPNWYAANDSLDAAARLKLANLGTLQGALGSTNSPAEDIRKVRNFFAHRSERTVADYRTTKIWATTKLRPDRALSHVVSGGGTIFDDWVSSLDLISVAACS